MNNVNPQQHKNVEGSSNYIENHDVDDDGEDKEFNVQPQSYQGKQGQEYIRQHGQNKNNKLSQYNDEYSDQENEQYQINQHAQLRNVFLQDSDNQGVIEKQWFYSFQENSEDNIENHQQMSQIHSSQFQSQQQSQNSQQKYSQYANQQSNQVKQSGMSQNYYNHNQFQNPSQQPSQMSGIIYDKYNRIVGISQQDEGGGGEEEIDQDKEEPIQNNQYAGGQYSQLVEGDQQMLYKEDMQQQPDEDQQQGMIICNKCMNYPVNYIELNCQHSFCLNCMAIWFIEKEYLTPEQIFDQPLSSSEENYSELKEQLTIDTECMLCGIQTLLDYDSVEAVKDVMRQIQIEQMQISNMQMMHLNQFSDQQQYPFSINKLQPKNQLLNQSEHEFQNQQSNNQQQENQQQTHNQQDYNQNINQQFTKQYFNEQQEVQNNNKQNFPQNHKQIQEINQQTIQQLKNDNKSEEQEIKHQENIHQKQQQKDNLNQVINVKNYIDSNNQKQSIESESQSQQKSQGYQPQLGNISLQQLQPIIQQQQSPVIKPQSDSQINQHQANRQEIIYEDSSETFQTEETNRNQNNQIPSDRNSLQESQVQMNQSLKNEFKQLEKNYQSQNQIIEDGSKMVQGKDIKKFINISNKNYHNVINSQQSFSNNNSPHNNSTPYDTNSMNIFSKKNQDYTSFSNSQFNASQTSQSQSDFIVKDQQIINSQSLPFNEYMKMQSDQLNLISPQNMQAQTIQMQNPMHLGELTLSNYSGSNISHIHEGNTMSDIQKKIIQKANNEQNKGGSDQVTKKQSSKVTPQQLSSENNTEGFQLENVEEQYREQTDDENEEGEYMNNLLKKQQHVSYKNTQSENRNKQLEQEQKNEENKQQELNYDDFANMTESDVSEDSQYKNLEFDLIQKNQKIDQKININDKMNINSNVYQQNQQQKIQNEKQQQILQQKNQNELNNQDSSNLNQFTQQLMKMQQKSQTQQEQQNRDIIYNQQQQQYHKPNLFDKRQIQDYKPSQQVNKHNQNNESIEDAQINEYIDDEKLECDLRANESEEEDAQMAFSNQLYQQNTTDDKRSYTKYSSQIDGGEVYYDTTGAATSFVNDQSHQLSQKGGGEKSDKGSNSVRPLYNVNQYEPLEDSSIKKKSNQQKFIILNNNNFQSNLSTDCNYHSGKTTNQLNNQINSQFFPQKFENTQYLQQVNSNFEEQQRSQKQQQNKQNLNFRKEEDIQGKYVNSYITDQKTMDLIQQKSEQQPKRNSQQQMVDDRLQNQSNQKQNIVNQVNQIQLSQPKQQIEQQNQNLKNNFDNISNYNKNNNLQENQLDKQQKNFEKLNDKNQNLQGKQHQLNQDNNIINEQTNIENNEKFNKLQKQQQQQNQELNLNKYGQSVDQQKSSNNQLNQNHLDKKPQPQQNQNNINMKRDPSPLQIKQNDKQQIQQSSLSTNQNQNQQKREQNLKVNDLKHQQYLTQIENQVDANNIEINDEINNNNEYNRNQFEKNNYHLSKNDQYDSKNQDYNYNLENDIQDEQEQLQNDEDIQSLELKFLPQCEEHPYEELGFFNFSQNKCICLKCLQNGDFMAEDVTNFEKGQNILLEKVDDCISQINVSIELLKLTTKRQEEKHRKRVEKANQTKLIIDEQFELIYQKLEEKQNQLLSETEDIFKTSETFLNSQVEQLSSKFQILAQLRNHFCEINQNNVKPNVKTYKEFQFCKDILDQFLFENEDILQLANNNNLSGSPNSSAQKNLSHQNQQTLLQLSQYDIINNFKVDEVIQFIDQIQFLRNKITDLKGVEIGLTHSSLRNSFTNNPKNQPTNQNYNQNPNNISITQKMPNNIYAPQVQSFINEDQNSSSQVYKEPKPYYKSSDKSSRRQSSSQQQLQQPVQQHSNLNSYFQCPQSQSPSQQQQQNVDEQIYPPHFDIDEFANQQQLNLQQQIQQQYQQQQTQNQIQQQLKLQQQLQQKQQLQQQIQQLQEQQIQQQQHQLQLQKNNSPSSLLGFSLQNQKINANKQQLNDKIQLFKVKNKESNSTQSNQNHNQFNNNSLNIGNISNTNQKNSQINPLFQTNINSPTIAQQQEIFNNSSSQQSLMKSQSQKNFYEQHLQYSQQQPSLTQDKTTINPISPSFINSNTQNNITITDYQERKQQKTDPGNSAFNLYTYNQLSNNAQQQQHLQQFEQILQNHLGGGGTRHNLSNVNTHVMSLLEGGVSHHIASTSEVSRNIQLIDDQFANFKSNLAEEFNNLENHTLKRSQQPTASASKVNSSAIDLFRKTNSVANILSVPSSNNHQSPNRYTLLKGSSKVSNNINQTLPKSNEYYNRSQFVTNYYNSKTGSNYSNNNSNLNIKIGSKNNTFNHRVKGNDDSQSQLFSTPITMNNNNNNSILTKKRQSQIIRSHFNSNQNNSFNNLNNFSSELKNSFCENPSINNSCNRYNTKKSDITIGSSHVNSTLPFSINSAATTTYAQQIFNIGQNSSFSKSKQASHGNLHSFYNNNTSLNNNTNIHHTIGNEFNQNVSFQGTTGKSYNTKSNTNTFDTKNSGYIYKSLKKYSDLFRRQKIMFENEN